MLNAYILVIRCSSPQAETAARSIRLWRLRGLLDLLTTGRPDRAQVSSVRQPITGRFVL